MTFNTSMTTIARVYLTILSILIILRKGEPLRTIPTFTSNKNFRTIFRSTRTLTHRHHLSFNDENNDNDNNDDEDRLAHNTNLDQHNPERNQTDLRPDTEGILSRFTSPKIDDPYLPLSDVLVAQVIAPSLEVAWLSLNHAPSPSWLQPIFSSSVLYSSRGSLLAPALIHGAALATCWLTGALAAKAYERPAFLPNRETGGYGSVLIKVLQAGAFATGILIFFAQIDLFWEFGGQYVQFGDSEETDFRLLTAAVELINDVFFEAVTLITWRLFLAVQNSRGNS